MGRNKITGSTKIPQHIAIIMDGNGRWAKKRLMPRSFGHKKGMERMIGLMERAFDLGVSYVTVYALSTENLNRPEEELNGLYDLIRNHFEGYMERFYKKGVRLRIIGETHLLPADVQEIIKKVEQKTAHCIGKGVNVALCYGSRAELVRAVNMAIEKGERVTEDSLSSLLYTAGQPDPDLLIRTGREVRLSNFLLWQAAYAELYFSDKMFPEFSDKDLEKAVAWFSSRVRRFGKTDEQVANG
ncbi:MAG: di-trans,poly-cis-decaprenylcistransferase [Clostridia bacterium]|nr:di-trans,poly-cis-decaprenylcistransferase [Clostridia bacterium]